VDNAQPKPQTFAEWKRLHDLTDEEIAAKVGCTRGAISHILRGARDAGDDLADALVLLTGLPFVEFARARKLAQERASEQAPARTDGTCENAQVPAAPDTHEAA
jgi:transcriptional regulator with XRE-family HTH domain